MGQVLHACQEYGAHPLAYGYPSATPGLEQQQSPYNYVAPVGYYDGVIFHR